MNKDQIKQLGTKLKTVEVPEYGTCYLKPVPYKKFLESEKLDDETNPGIYVATLVASSWCDESGNLIWDSVQELDDSNVDAGVVALLFRTIRNRYNVPIEALEKNS